MDRERKESFQRGLVIAFQKYTFTQEEQVPGLMTDEYLSGEFPSNTCSVWPTSWSYQHVVALGLPTGCAKRQYPELSVRKDRATCICHANNVHNRDTHGAWGWRL